MASCVVFLSLLLGVVYTNWGSTSIVEGLNRPFPGVLCREKEAIELLSLAAQGLFHRFWPMGLYGSDDNNIECL